MDEPARVSFREGRLASRKAQESADRRSQAATWLDLLVGPLGLPSLHPSEQEFISSLRSGIALCNALNKIQPGLVPKVITNQLEPLPAYQYFENIRNFLFAVEELKLPSFEASDLERDTLEAGSAAKIVNCVLGLKGYYEWKQQSNNGGCGLWKHAVKSPLVPQISRIQSSSGNFVSSVRRLDLSATNGEKLQVVQNEQPKNLRDNMDSLVQLLSNCMYNSKENIDQNLLEPWRSGSMVSTKLFNNIISSCLLEDESRSVLKDLLVEENTKMDNSSTLQLQKSKISESGFPSEVKYSASEPTNQGVFDPFAPSDVGVFFYGVFSKCCNLDLLKEDCNHRHLLKAQENEVAELKSILSETRVDFVTLQSQLRNDLTQLGTKIQGISAAAIGYHQAVKENRNLYNMLQELRGNIRVYCRIRPSSNHEVRSSIDHIGNDGSLIILDPLKPQIARKVFNFNKVFGPNALQEDVYKDTQSLVRSVTDGYNVCIFAYGQTGSGKTHTMCGPPNGPDKDMGINYMALNDLFELSCTRNDIKYSIRVQMVEIYNEQVRDLLCEDASSTKLEIRNCSGNGGLSLPDATMHDVQSTTDVLNLMQLGERNRAFSSTAMNNRSSRSHSVLTVHVHGEDVSGTMLQSCLHLVDLAGSERVDKSEVTGERLKEAQYINKSLACLGDVIAALAQKNSHIPYRNSKLTQLLQNSLGGHAKMLMFAHVSPEADSYGETISTLKFAQRAATVELGAAQVNKESSEIRQLKEVIDNLKKALATKDEEKGFTSQKPERLKLLNDKTPPRPRRLSIESSIGRRTLAANPDGKKTLKSPIPRPKFDTEHIRSRRLSLEDSQCEESKSSASKNHLSDAPRLLKENVVCEDGLELKENLTEDTPTSFDLSYRSQVRDSESRYNRISLKQPRKLDELVMTPDANSNRHKMGFSSNSNITKGSHIRKSLQNISKLINSSERRGHQHPAEVTPSGKYGRNNDIIVIKSPVTADARSRRRQSLTNVHPSEVSNSRRSSLGGQSTDAYSAGVRKARTNTPPPPVHPSPAKASKQRI